MLRRVSSTQSTPQEWPFEYLEACSYKMFGIIGANTADIHIVNEKGRSDNQRITNTFSFILDNILQHSWSLNFRYHSFVSSHISLSSDISYH